LFAYFIPTNVFAQTGLCDNDWLPVRRADNIAIFRNLKLALCRHNDDAAIVLFQVGFGWRRFRSRPVFKSSGQLEEVIRARQVPSSVRMSEMCEDKSQVSF